MELLSDNPITKEHDDTFGFGPFVNILGDAILGTKSLPFTLGIFGEWGTGKTSLMHLLCDWLDRCLFGWDNVPGNDSERLLRFLTEDLDIDWAENAKIRKSDDDKTIHISNDENSAEILIDKKKEKATLKISDGGTHYLKVKKENGKLNIYNECETVWFNPWKYDNKEELWTALIRSILLEIYNKTPKKKLKKEVWTLLKDIAWFTFKGGVSTATGGVISIGNLEKMKKIVAAESEREHDFLNRFESNFSQLVEDFVGKKGRLIVFIDDLDRCIPENAITVLESLKLYLDNPHCAFVLGMDRTIIELGIKHRYGEHIQLSGREYLEKIVQLPFFLPPIQFGKLQQALQSQSKAANYTPQIWTLLRYGLGGNPRKAKRFVNSFYMAQEALKRPEVAEQLVFANMDDNAGNMEDVPYENQLFYLAKALVIQMSYTDFYDYLLINPSGLIIYESSLFELKRGGEKNASEVLEERYPDLAIHWQNRRLRLFMQRTSGGDFPSPPSPFIMERILRFTGIVEREKIKFTAKDFSAGKKAAEQEYF